MEKEFKISLLKHIIKVNISSSKTLKMETQNPKVSAPANNPRNNPQVPQDENEVLFKRLFKYSSAWRSNHEHLIIGLHKLWKLRLQETGRSFLHEQEKMQLYDTLAWLRKSFPKIEG